MPVANVNKVQVNAAIVADVDAGVPASTNLRLMGWNARATVAGNFKIKNSATGAAGTILATVALALDEHKFAWFGPKGLDASDGLSIDWVVGTHDIELYYDDS